MEQKAECCQIGELRTQLNDVQRDIANILAVMEKTQVIVDKVSAEVMPTIEKLTKNPLLRMALH